MPDVWPWTLAHKIQHWAKLAHIELRDETMTKFDLKCGGSCDPLGQIECGEVRWARCTKCFADYVKKIWGEGLNIERNGEKH